jgi:hypothetical protein
VDGKRFADVGQIQPIGAARCSMPVTRSPSEVTTWSAGRPFHALPWSKMCPSPSHWVEHCNGIAITSSASPRPCGKPWLPRAASVPVSGGALADQVGEDVPGLVQHHRAVRDREDEFLAVLAGPVVSRAGLAVRGLAVRVVVVQQSGHGLLDDEDGIAAASAVAPVGAAQRLELLTVYADATVASVTRGGMQLDAVHEGGHGGCLQVQQKKYGIVS